MKLSLVIPVFNDVAGLARLLAQVAALNIAYEVIVVDDGSDNPCRAHFAGNPVAGARMVWLRTEAGLGAGHARNLGQAAVSGTHVLFFDADDELTPEIITLLRELDGQAFDFCLFAHHDSRLLARGLGGPQEPPDRAFWAHCRPGDTPRQMTMAEAQVYCRLSNYPWNKIWRAGFLHEAGVRCTEIPLHNDIEPHWAGFLSARRALVSGRHCAVHHVTAEKGQLSNRRGADRIRLFEALSAVVARLEREIAIDPAREGFAGPLLEFVCRLLGWAQTRLDDEETALMRACAHGFVAALAREASPALSAAIQRALAEEPGLAPRFVTVFGEVL